MSKKKFYLHISYTAQFDEYSSMRSDNFFRLDSITLKELRQSIWNNVERNSNRKVKSLSLNNITELSEDLFNMLTKNESFEDLESNIKKEE